MVTEIDVGPGLRARESLAMACRSVADNATAREGAEVIAGSLGDVAA